MSTTTTDDGKVGNVHPVTSAEAASTTDARGQAHLIFQYLARRGAQGATAAEVADGLGVRSRNQVATRLMELREAGRIVRLKRTRSTGPRSRGHVHVVASWAHMFASDAILAEEPRPDAMEVFRGLCRDRGFGGSFADRFLDDLRANGVTLAVRRRP